MPKTKVKGQTVQIGERPQTNERTDTTKRIIIAPAARSMDKYGVRYSLCATWTQQTHDVKVLMKLKRLTTRKNPRLHLITRNSTDYKWRTQTVNSGGMDGLTTGWMMWWSGSTTVCGAGAARVRWGVAWCGARLDDDDDDVEMPTYGGVWWWCACLRGSVATSSSCNCTHQNIASFQHIFLHSYLTGDLSVKRRKIRQISDLS